MDGFAGAEAVVERMLTAVSAKCRDKKVCLQPISPKSGPLALGSSVQTSPLEHSPAELDSSIVKVPLSPLGPPRIPELPGETCSKNNLATPSLKIVNGCLSSVTGLESPGIPDIPYQALSSDTPQLGVECTPGSADPGLELHLTADSPRSEPDNSMILVDVALPAVGFPRTASCPAMMQLCTPKSRFPVGPSYAEILCGGIGAVPTGSLVGGEASWQISEDDRRAALGLVDDPLDPVLEPPIGLVYYPPGPPDPEVDLHKTPPSISRILTKYSLDTSLHLGHGSSSPNSMCVASSTDSHLDNSEVSYLGPQADPPQLDSWQPVKSRRKRKSASKNSKGLTRFMMRRPILMIGLRLMVLTLTCCWVPELQYLVADSFSANAVMSCCPVFADDGAG
ncbi:hypothetical protein Nepgr_018755 [Nepenthes gracilis]|uniref:Uncharacterized protein n=1 Tax=Nepenthes gracilis TaxID=150966 RepID=A0AAD3STZ1_NEPGR|nr:hypothetical protein Nepgr_018755 [Nepenthes gracilis]